MKIVFFSNYFNHHQKPLADAMNSLDYVDYTFVATSNVPEFRKRMGYQEMTADYVLDVTKSELNRQTALRLAVEADVAIFGTTGMNEYIVPRLKTGKLTFEYSERWLKKKFKLNLLSKNLWKHQMMYYIYGRKANLYMLCASAYASNDYYLLHSYKDRCFKWAYFTQVPNLDIDAILANKRKKKYRIMWCSRFISWKHPELVIALSSRLKNEGYDFELSMYGNGPLMDEIRKEILKNNLENYVFLMGSVSNEEIIKAMQQHHIFLFTSDQNEGWGAVANETMSNGCTLVGSNKIGCVPFLLDDGKNGLVFKSKDINSLFDKVNNLMKNSKLCEEYAKNAYYTMRDVWSPKSAANRLLKLIVDLQKGVEPSFFDGPCSKAFPI